MPDTIRMSIIDTEDGFVELMKTAIESADMRVHFMRDRHWKQTIERFTSADMHRPEELPQIILMNIEGGQADWKKGLDAIKMTPWLKRLPLIACSASYHHKSVVEAYERHANCFVLKPADAADAVPWLKKLINFWIDTVSPPQALLNF